MRRPEVFKAIVGQGHWKSALQAYMACISYVDAQIGRVLDALDASPYAANTVVVLVGDNGWHNRREVSRVTSWQTLTSWHVTTGGTTGEKFHFSKCTLWAESTRVPLMISVPGSPAATCDVPVSLVDLFPTLLDLCGLPAPDTHELDGVNLAPLLDDPTGERGRPVLVTQGFGNHAVVSRDFRFIRYRDGTEELYNLEADPNEWDNLIRADVSDEVRRSMQRFLPVSEAEPIPSKGTAVGG